MRAQTLACSPLRAWCEGLPRPLELQPIYRLLGQPLFNIERALILATLEQCEWNRTRAANQLGISIRTMRNKIAGFTLEGIAVPAGQEAGRENRQRFRDRIPPSSLG
jgi:Fis family transcriptional regulator, factor for inversion stimulation protein